MVDPDTVKTLRRILADIRKQKYTVAFSGTVRTDAGDMTMDLLATLADQALDHVVEQQRLATKPARPVFPPNRVITEGDL